ncbi:hypothetical protein BG005_009673, partial [Podila minutissima]
MTEGARDCDMRSNGRASTPVTRAVGAVVQLNIRETQSTYPVIFAEDTPMEHFTIKQARLYLMEKTVAKTAALHRAKEQKPKDRAYWAPIFENMPTQI